MDINIKTIVQLSNKMKSNKTKQPNIPIGNQNKTTKQGKAHLFALFYHKFIS